MQNLDDFQQRCKMTRLGPEPLSTISGPPPVKFKPVYFNPSFIDVDNTNLPTPSSDEFDLDEEMLHADLSFNGNHFFKNPVCPSFKETDENTADEESESSVKLGHNMRACQSNQTRNADKTVWGQMVARKQLLDEQKKQHLKFSKRDTTDREAMALVNNLLQQGFHITMPENTQRTADDQCVSETNLDVDPLSSVIHQEGEFMKSVHNELKRVQGISDSTPLS